MNEKEDTLKYSEVFLFPQQTDYIFRLFIISLAGISLIIGTYLPYLIFELDLSPFARLPLTEFYDVDKVYSMNEVEFLRNLKKILIPLALQIFYAGTVFGISYFVYKRKPEKIIKKNNLTEVRDENLLSSLEDIKSASGITTGMKYYTNDNIMDFSAQVFGTGKVKYLKCGKGLLKILRNKNPELYENVILHEFAHIKNKDIGKTYFAESVLKIPLLIISATFIIASAFVFLNSQVGKIIRSEFNFYNFLQSFLSTANVVLQILALSVILFLLFRLLVRNREYYADLRVADYFGKDILKEFFNKSPHSNNGFNYKSIFKFHPSHEQREKVLENPVKVFTPSYLITFLTGMISYVFILFAGMFGMSFIMLTSSLIIFPVLFLLKGLLPSIIHLNIVCSLIVLSFILTGIFFIMCGNFLRKNLFCQMDNQVVYETYSNDKPAYSSRILQLSFFIAMGLIAGYLVMPLFGFHILNLNNALAAPFVFLFSLLGFFILNLIHYKIIKYRFLRFKKEKLTIPWYLKLLESIGVIFIMVVSILLFSFLIPLLIK